MGNNTSLEDSIREESDKAIAAIREKESLEIAQLDSSFAAEIDAFRKKTEAETDAKLRQEVYKLENKAILERRKLKLRSMEQFIDIMVGEIMKGIRDNPLYVKFLIEAVCGIVLQIPDAAEVRLKPEDLSLENDIKKAVKDAGINQRVVIKGDPGILWGGCLVWDKAQKRVLNNTIERIYFRKSLLIRQKVMKILMEHFGDGKKPIQEQMSPGV
ncbi:MAG TPA: hypothetical protein VMU29_06625 [Smithella sp.]|nr:hypothetical protein [Smithella sp.]